jgi:hypothetical protein
MNSNTKMVGSPDKDGANYLNHMKIANNLLQEKISTIFPCLKCFTFFSWPALASNFPSVEK